MGEPGSPKARPRSLHLPAEVLFDLEEVLNAPRFMGVPIGSTLGDVFSLHLLNGNRNWNQRTIWADRVRLAYRFARGLRVPPLSREVSRPQQARRILATVIGDQGRVRGLIQPVVERLGPDNCNVFVGTHGEPGASLPGLHTFTSSALLGYFDRAAWRKEFVSCFPQWRRRLRQALDAHGIPRFVAPHLLDAMMHSSQLVAAYHRLLEDLNPAVIVTDYDRNPTFSGLVLAARTRGIAAVTLLHGVINPPYGYVPLLADVACCWGDLSRQQLIEMGTDPERLVVTGYHRTVPEPGIDRREARYRIGIYDDRPVVVWASNPIGIEMRRAQVRTFCQALSEWGEIGPVVRLHPSEVLETYAKEISEFPMVRFTEASLVTEREMLSAAEVIVSYNSGLGNDALVAGKPVVVLNVTELPLGNAQPLIEKARCPYVRNAQELKQAVDRILTDRAWREELEASAQKFVLHQFASFGEEALENVVRVVRERGRLPI